jgi:hypothetical protein
MTSRTIVDAFADAATRLLRPADVSGSLVALLSDCAELTEADSAGLLIRADDGSLELLSSTSHTTTVLELYELQNGRGPCLEAVQTNVFVSGTAPDLARRWVPVGQAIVDAGYAAVYAFPLRWGDHAVGALNLYATTDRFDDDAQRTGQAFANLAVAVLAHPHAPDWSDVHRDVLDLLEERIAIEQAKGVLAVRHGLDMAAAYQRLITTAAEQQLSLTQYAQDVIDSTTRR